MREVKFRAWDKKDKVVRAVIGMSFYHEALSVDIGYGRYLQDDITRFELMQYIGLRDINGTEIYEGDVIKGTALKAEGGFDYLGVVEFDYTNTTYGLHVAETSKKGLSGRWEITQLRTRISLDHITGEVIGNIYENPELLENE